MKIKEMIKNKSRPLFWHYDDWELKLVIGFRNISQARAAEKFIKKMKSSSE